MFISGLKKFLAQYPALFNIDGDFVHVNEYQALRNSDSSGNNDYIEETKDYFKNKLLQYGIGTEVPIKSLLGHRSQASPQVRHISGQHIKEFTDFLSKHPDTFQVIDENVLLVGCENEQDVPQSERLHLPQPSIDTGATQELLDFIADTIENQGPTIVFQLFHAITSKFPQEQWFRIFKTPNDLSAFLRLFSDCFHVQSDLVSLLQKPKLSDSHIKHAQAAFASTSNNNYFKRVNTNTVANTTSSNSSTTNPNPNIINNNNSSHQAIKRTISPPQTKNGLVDKVDAPTKVDFKLNEPVSAVNNNLVDTSISSIRSGEPSSGFDSLVTSEIKLENLCPNNCPTTIPNEKETKEQKEGSCTLFTFIIINKVAVDSSGTFKEA